jgi:hypothetical protein
MNKVFDKKKTFSFLNESGVLLMISMKKRSDSMI